MTVSEAITFCRNRHNALNDTFFGDVEIMSLMEAACNEVAAIIGEIEATDSSITTTTGTQSYAYPAYFEFINRIRYNGTDIQLIDFRDWDRMKINGVDPSGTPRYYIPWNKMIYLIPIPDATGDTLEIFAEKRQGAISTTLNTIDLPPILHARTMERVIGWMYEKDKDSNMAAEKLNEWQKVHIPAFYTYKSKYRRRGRAAIVKDADSSMNTDFGVR